MVRRADAGDIVMQARVPIEEKDTAFTLFGKIADSAARVVSAFYPLVEKGAYKKIPQDSSQATVFGGRRPQDGLFSWDQSYRAIYNLLRAVTHPYPGAYTAWNGKKLFVWWAQPIEGNSKGTRVPGTILAIKRGAGMLVAAGQGTLWVKRVQVEGEKEKQADIFAKEKKLKVGDRLS